MPNVKITEIPQVLSVQNTDDFYIKTGDAFCRVPVSSLIALVESGAATILNMTLTGSTVTLNMTPAALIELCGSQKKVYFMLGNIAFTVSGVDGANNRVNLYAIVDGVSYEVTLAQTSSTTMGGTLISYPTKHLDVTFSINTSTPVCDKTFSQITEAFSAGKMIRPVFDGFCGIVASVDSIEAQFWFIDGASSTPTWYIFSVDDTNAVTLQQRAIGNAMEPNVVLNSSASPLSFAAQNNTIYKFTASAVTALTSSSVPASGDCLIKFMSGSTPTVLTLPIAVDDLMPAGFAVEANTRYELSISDGYPVIYGWPISS